MCIHQDLLWHRGEQVGANLPLTFISVTQGNSAEVSGVLLLQNRSDWEIPSRTTLIYYPVCEKQSVVSTGWKTETEISQGYSFNPFK